MTSATVAICTHNRAQDASLCLDELAPQAKETGLSVIVVDSGSDPANAAELRRMAAVHEINYLRLDTQGLSLARNAAHQHASSDWIVYLDDDAIPDSRWAKSLLLALSDAPAEVAIVGGKITPAWPNGTDHSHITNLWKLLLSCVDHDGTGLASEGYNICGANFAVRRSAFDLAGQFPTTLGRTGECLVGGEESYLIHRLFSLGLMSTYNSTFAVHHRIQPSRLDLNWVTQRAYWEGVTRIRVIEELGRPTPLSMKIGKLLISMLALSVLRLASINPDYSIRYNMALGSLLCQLKLHD